MLGTTKLGLVFLIGFVVLIASLKAEISDFDDSWQKRAEEAHKAALEAYDPNPEEVTDSFNEEVDKFVLNNSNLFFFHIYIYIYILISFHIENINHSLSSTVFNQSHDVNFRHI